MVVLALLRYEGSSFFKTVKSSRECQSRFANKNQRQIMMNINKYQEIVIYSQLGEFQSPEDIFMDAGYYLIRN